MKIEYRKADIADAELLIEIYNSAFYSDYIKYGECPAYGKTKEMMEKSIIDYPKFIILCDSEPVGCISCKKMEAGTYEIGCLCVIPEFQGKGIGTKAVDFVKSHYRGWKKITLVTPIDKKENVKFYTEKCGFDIVSTEMDGNVEVARFVLKKKLRKRFLIFAVLLCAVCAFCLYQNYHITVTNYEYKADFDCRIVQISDLHNQFFGMNQKRLIDEIKNCDPDIIVVTGDVVDSGHTSYKLALDFFEGAVEIAPVYYITGNHEVWLYGEKFDEFLSEVKALGVQFMDGKVLSSENMIIAGTENGYGVKDYEWKDDERLKVLLAHEPSQHAAYLGEGADIVFAGHVHGGQVILPGKGGLISPDMEFFPDLYKGEYRFGDMTMYISAGLGNSVLPLRINNYPEIVVVDIVKE